MLQFGLKMEKIYWSIMLKFINVRLREVRSLKMLSGTLIVKDSFVPTDLFLYEILNTI